MSRVKTQLCFAFQDGKYQKGDLCCFAHGRQDLGSNNSTAALHQRGQKHGHGAIPRVSSVDLPPGQWFTGEPAPKRPRKSEYPAPYGAPARVTMPVKRPTFSKSGQPQTQPQPTVRPQRGWKTTSALPTRSGKILEAAPAWAEQDNHQNCRQSWMTQQLMWMQRSATRHMKRPPRCQLLSSQKCSPGQRCAHGPAAGPLTPSRKAAQTQNLRRR